MANPLNPSFETAGANAGEAQSWTQSQSDAGEVLAEFDTAGTADRPYEDYESGHYLPAASGDNGTSVLYVEDGVFVSAPDEDFERDHYLPDGQDWGVNQDSVLDWASALSTAADFDTTPTPYEDFEHEHDLPYGNPATYATTPAAFKNFSDIPSPPLPTASSSLAPFDTSPENYEDFEEGYGGQSSLFTMSTANLGGGSSEEGWESGWTSTMTW